MRNQQIHQLLLLNPDYKPDWSRYLNHYRTKTDEFLKIIKSLYGDKYDYSKVIFYNSKTKVTLSCEIHGEFNKDPYGLKTGHGCPKCGKSEGERRKPPEQKRKCMMPIDQFIERARKVHGEKYDYSKTVMNGLMRHVLIVCPVHGDFWQQAHNHMYGFGCAQCSKTNFYSKAGIEWINYLSVTRKDLRHAQNGGEFIIAPTRYRADAYDPATNTVYEFLGDFYHGNPAIYPSEYINKTTKTTMGELYAQTIARRDEIISYGYNYVEIWESQWTYAVKVVTWIQRLFRRSRGTLSERKVVKFPIRPPARFLMAPVGSETGKQEGEPNANATTELKAVTAATIVPTTETRLSKDLWKLILQYEIDYRGMFSWGMLETAKTTPEVLHADMMDIWKSLSVESRKRIRVSDFNDAIQWINQHFVPDIVADTSVGYLPEWVRRCERTGFWLALDPAHLVKKYIADRLTAQGF